MLTVAIQLLSRCLWSLSSHTIEHPWVPPAAPSSDPVGWTIVSVAKLYQLPVEELESTVADILREPGFEEFVSDNLCVLIGKLDKIWALLGFLRR
jgi:hypothetical protein